MVEMKSDWSVDMHSESVGPMHSKQSEEVHGTHGSAGDGEAFGANPALHMHFPSPLPLDNVVSAALQLLHEFPSCAIPHV